MFGRCQPLRGAEADLLARKSLGARRSSVFLSSPCPVHEVHPQVSFADAGILLDRIIKDSVAAARASVDDMLDAAVAAWSAARVVRGAARSFPGPPELDASGDQVAIWGVGGAPPPGDKPSKA